MIITKGLSKTYITKVKKGFMKSSVKTVEAVKNLDMEIEQGKIVGLLGINGSGKTSTIKMLSTLIEPDGGNATVDGLDVVKDSHKIKPIINMITSNERMLYWRLTARENLNYFGRLYGISQNDLDKRINELSSFVGLQDRIDELVETYSKGMKQRLQIARGLINNPKYILMDEPTLGLDVHIAKEIRNSVRQLATKSGKGILLTSHYLNEIEELCDYVYIINKGVKIAEGTPKDVAGMFSKFKNKYEIKVDKINDRLIEELRKAGGVSETMIDINDEVSNEVSINILTNLDIQKNIIEIVSSQARILSFHLQGPSLEEVIIKLAEDQKNEDDIKNNRFRSI